MKISKEQARATAASQLGRYEMVHLAERWVSVLKRREDTRDIGQSELIKRAVEEVRSGVVNADDIEAGLKLLINTPLPPPDPIAVPIVPPEV